jgi:hypothetical protein
VLDLAAGQVEPAAHVTLAGVRRFIRTDRTGRAAPDLEYADLTLDMRTGEDPGAVFDALAARDQIQLRLDGAALQASRAKAAVVSFRGGEAVAVVADTREQTASLNAAIRDQLVADQLVDDSRVVTTLAGQRIGAGDRIATRRNDPDLEVVNRDTWTVIAVDQRGGLSVTPAHVTPPTVAVHGDVTPAVARERALPADYVARYVALGYASTAHGVQGDTVSNAHVVVGEHTGAAAAYVGMTRGRWSNTAHLIAEDLTDAREQWITVFTRDRADLGPAHAGRLAAAEAAATPRERSVERAPTEVGGGIRPPAPETYRAPRCAAGAHVRR